MALAALNALVILGAALLFDLVGVPAGPLIGAMVAAVVLQATRRLVLVVPRWARTLSLGTLGWIVGSTVTREAVEALWRSAGPILAGLSAILLVSWALGWALQRYSDLDVPTATLCVAPGGLVEVLALAEAAGVRVEVVLATHLLRILGAVIVVSAVATLVAG